MSIWKDIWLPILTGFGIPAIVAVIVVGCYWLTHKQPEISDVSTDLTRFVLVEKGFAKSADDRGPYLYIIKDKITGDLYLVNDQSTPIKIPSREVK